MDTILVLAGVAVLLVPILYLSRKAVVRLGRQETRSKELTKAMRQLSKLAGIEARLEELQRRVQESESRELSAVKQLEERMRKSLDAASRDLRLTTGLLGLDLRFPLFLGDWAIDAVMAREIVDTLERTRPRVVLELGSGTSTVVIAAILKKLGLAQTRHIAVDHLQEFVDVTGRQLELQGLGGKTELWHCPLGGEPPWYSGLVERLAGTKLDLLLVDGPPATSTVQARRPALPLLAPFLSERAVILVDDARRGAERKMIAEWEGQHPDLTFSYSNRGKGLARIEKKRIDPASSEPSKS